MKNFIDYLYELRDDVIAMLIRVGIIDGSATIWTVDHHDGYDGRTPADLDFVRFYRG